MNNFTLFRFFQLTLFSFIIFLFGTKAFSAEYCDAGHTINEEFICSFTLNTINNNDCNWQSGTGDYLGFSTNLAIGSTYPVSVKVGKPFSGDRVRLFVDFDNNKNLNTDEAFYLATTDGVNFQGNIIVPMNAKLGKTRLRVHLAWNQDPVPCGVHTWGEFEDYSVVITPPIQDNPPDNNYNAPNNYCIPGPNSVTANNPKEMWCYPSYLKSMSNLYDYYMTNPIKEVRFTDASNGDIKLLRRSYGYGGMQQGPWEGCYIYTNTRAKLSLGTEYYLKVVVENNYYGYSGTNYCSYNYNSNYVFRIFLDKNINGIFDESEWINSPTNISNGSTIKIGNTTNWSYTAVANCSDRTQEYKITIPPNQQIGTCRMRVMHSYYYPSTMGNTFGTAGNACWNGYAYDYGNNNWYGYNYGEIEDYLVEFVASKPNVITVNSSNIKAKTVTLSGNVTSDGGAPVTQRGFCWSKAANPTMANDYVLSGQGLGAFSETINYLDAGTKYYFRSFATNSIGISYGNELNFTTLQAITLNLPNQTSCSGSSVVLGPQNMITGGSGNYTIYWSPEIMLDNPNIAHPTATVPMTTLFNITVTDNLTGELVNGNLLVDVGSRPNVSASGMYRHPKDTPLDLNSIITISGGTPPYTSSWFTLNGDPVLNVNAFVPPIGVTQFNVIAYDQSGCPSVAKRVTIYVAPRKDVGEVVAGLSNNTYMVAYPNPVESSIEVSAVFTQDKNNVTIRVVDMQGIEVYRSVQNSGSELSMRLNLGHLTTGAYNLIVESGDDVAIKKIIKQ